MCCLEIRHGDALTFSLIFPRFKIKALRDLRLQRTTKASSSSSSFSSFLHFFLGSVTTSESAYSVISKQALRSRLMNLFGPDAVNSGAKAYRPSLGLSRCRT